MQEALKLLRTHLAGVLADIDSGNCHMSDSQMQAALLVLSARTSPANNIQSAYSVAKAYGVTQKTIYNWERDGVLPHHFNIPGANGNFWYTDELAIAEPAMLKNGYIKSKVYSKVNI